MPTKPKLQIRVASLDDATVLQRLINTTFNRPLKGPINSAYFQSPTVTTFVGVLNDGRITNYGFKKVSSLKHLTTNTQ